jgi:hypothetical protein
MQVMGYSSEELKLFHSVLDRAMSEATAMDIRVPLHTMTKRLFDAASMGERDPIKLRAAILEDVIFPVAGSFPSGAVACPSVAVEPV